MIDFRELTMKDASYFKEAVDLLNRTQGQNLFAQNYIEASINEPTSYVVAAFESTKLLGVAIAKVIDEYSYYLPFQADIATEFQNLKVGSFSTMSVLEGRQGQGIGQKLSQMRIAWLQTQRCQVVVGVSWVSGLAHTSNRAFEKMGFQPVKKVDQFYYQSSIEKPFVCPGCGEPPCTCSAILYKLKLDK